MYLEESITPLIDRFDAFVIDIWGVLHDGNAAYAGAAEALAALKEAKKKIILLSNAPRRAHVAANLLAQLGIEEPLYDHLLTSGEITFRYLQQQATHKGWKRCFYLGPAREMSVIDELDAVIKTDDPTAADFCLMTGFSSSDSTLDEHKEGLDAALKAGLPLLCPNPDMSVVRQTGERWLCAGVAAAYYAEQGGDVTYIGKPYPMVYDACFNALGLLPRSRVCAIGDGLETDIKGANDAHLFAVLVAGGLLSQHVIENGKVNMEKLAAHCEAEGISPNAVLARFTL